MWENISPPILYAELNRGTNKNGEPDEYLRYFLYYPGNHTLCHPIRIASMRQF